VCKQIIKGIRFKDHVLRHWVSSKKDESFSEFLGRVYKSNEKIPFKLLDDLRTEPSYNQQQY